MTSADSPKILVVDDEINICRSVEKILSKVGIRVRSALNGEEALSLLAAEAFDAVLTDLKMSRLGGMEVLRRAKELNPGLPVVVMTGYASVSSAVEVMKLGAVDYLPKPFTPDEIRAVVRQALSAAPPSGLSAEVPMAPTPGAMTHQLIGNSSKIRQVISMVEKVAPTDSTVLVGGESGTGKELIARAIHANSRRRYFPIIPVNCGGLPESLLESELFGHEKGAFTGAQHRRKGKLEMADGGTLFLDEIGAIDLKMQVDLLRVLESREFTRIGGSRPIKVDFRVICATNENLEKAVAEGRFREDFYYRVNVFTIEAPPLRTRPADIPLLARYFLERFARQMDKRITGISPEAMELLTAYDWPGNVRELSNAIERAMVVGTPPLIRPDDLPVKKPGQGAATGLGSLADVERRHIASVLAETEWNVTRAAEVLQVDRVTVYNKIKKYGLSR